MLQNMPSWIYKIYKRTGEELTDLYVGHMAEQIRKKLKQRLQEARLL